MPRPGIPVIIGGIRYQSIAAAAKELHISSGGILYALRYGQRRDGLVITYAPEIAAVEKSKSKTRQRDWIVEWYKRHRLDSPYRKRKPTRNPGEPLLRKRTFGEEKE